MNRYRNVVWIVVMLVLLIIAGCNHSENDQQEAIGYISITKESEYENTFRELNLGVLFDFQLNILEADTSWMHVWLEGYQGGEEISSSPITGLSVGNSPNKTLEGPLVFGLINPDSEDNISYFMKVPGGGIPVAPLDNILNTEGVKGKHWGYSIRENEKIALELGETKTLAVYRETGPVVKTLDYGDEQHISEMIEEGHTVLLLKIKVDRMPTKLENTED